MNSYTGPEGGPEAGPSSKITDVAKKAKSLADIFFAVIPFTVFVKVSKYTVGCLYNHHVAEKTGKDHNENDKGKTYFLDVPPSEVSSIPNIQHRTDNRKKKYASTSSHIILFFTIFVGTNEHFGTTKRDTCKIWRKSPYGLNLPYIRNAITRDDFKFIRRRSKFSDNHQQKD